jgi:hypothetical protein
MAFPSPGRISAGGAEIAPSRWLALMEHEYLADYIRDGGAAVKFAVPADTAARLAVREGLRAAAERDGFAFALVDAEVTKIHLIDQVFHHIARQIDWDELTEAFLKRLLSTNGYTLPPPADALTLSSLARANGLPEDLFRGRIDQLLVGHVFSDYAMAQEFRFAMLHLCEGCLGIESPELVASVRDWLKGELRLLSALKRALIFQKIARHNARHMLISLTHWLHLAGRSGLVLALDIARYSDARRPSERGQGLYYSRAATLDAYEVLRQLIDGTDALQHCFVCVLADPLFLSDDRRGMRAYQALEMRISDEVRDRYRPNPLAALARLDEAP